MARHTSPKPSAGRVQDWISSVLNPIIDGLRRERGFLINGPWFWNHHSRSFEYFNRIVDFVPDIYHDNLIDFVSKHPRLNSDFNRHDHLLSELGSAVDLTFQRLVGPSGSDAQNVFREAVLSQEGKAPDLQDFSYIASYFASSVGQLPDRYSHYQIYNTNSALRDAMARICAKEREKAVDVAKQLENAAQRLHDKLVSIRTGLADQYGARIRPVDPNAVGY